MSVYAYTYTHAYISTYVCQAISAYNWNQKQQKNGDKLKKKNFLNLSQLSQTKVFFPKFHFKCWLMVNLASKFQPIWLVEA